MKNWLIILLILNTSSALALKCDDLRLNLLGLENEIQTSQLAKCSDKNSSKTCRLTSDDSKATYSQTYADIKNNYNKKLANLILLQGMKAIAETIQDNHSSLTMLTPKRLKKAKSYISDLTIAVDKAELINSAMVSVKNDHGNLTSVWSKYKIGHQDDNDGRNIENFIRKMQNGCKDIKPLPEEEDLAVQNEIALCKNFGKNMDYNKENGHSEVIKAFYGYAMADLKVQITDQNPDYSEYKETLKIRDKKNGSPSSIDKFKNDYLNGSGVFFDLKTAIKNFEEAKSKSPSDPIEIGIRGKSVLSASNKLEPISVSFNGINNLEEDDISNVLKNHISNFEMNISTSQDNKSAPFNLSDTFSTELFQQKLIDQTSLMTNDLDVLQKGLLNSGDERVNSCKAKANSCKSNNKACRVTPMSCLKSACSKSLGTTDNFCAKVAKLTTTSSENKDILNKMNEAQLCYKVSGFKEKKKCLNDIRNSMPEFEKNEAELKSEIESAKNLMGKFNKAYPFNKLISKKILTLSALSDMGCNKEPIKSYTCNGRDNTFLDGDLLKLGDTLGEVSIRMNSTEVNVSLGIDIKGHDQRTDFFKSKEEFIIECEGKSSLKKNNIASVCDFYISNKKLDQKVERDRLAHKRKRANRVIARSYRRPYSPPKSYGWFDAVKDSAAILGQNSGLIVNTLIGLHETEKQTDYQHFMINKKSEEFDKYVDYVNENQKYSDVTMINYGGAFMHDGYYYQGNFQQDFVEDIYSPSTDPYMFSFTPNIQTPGSTTTPTVQENIGTGTTNNVLEFNFNPNLWQPQNS